jgi:hypothetical protein
MHLLFLLAPPLLSHDVFSYIAYARLGVANHLNPYTHAPLDIPNDPGFTHAGSIDASSAYGPVFTLLTYPLSPLGVPAAFWILKVVAALSSLGVVALVWRIAQRLGRDPLVPALAVGLNPLVLVHVVGGAHNEALTLLITMAGVLLWLSPRAERGDRAECQPHSERARRQQHDDVHQQRDPQRRVEEWSGERAVSAACAREPQRSEQPAGRAAGRRHHQVRPGCRGQCGHEHVEHAERAQRELCGARAQPWGWTVAAGGAAPPPSVPVGAFPLPFPFPLFPGVVGACGCGSCCGGAS